MKFIRSLHLIIILSSYIICYSQVGIWAWIKGDSIVNSPGSFGIQGIPSPANVPPGRYASGYWTDTAGNFWVFGGAVFGTDDLWKFDPQTLMWTWMKGNAAESVTEEHNGAKGIYDSINSPGYLFFGMFTWVTPDNHLWLFGGAAPKGLNSDLWQYAPEINQWAWMGTFGPRNYGTKGVGDSTTMPGGKYEGNCAWTDNNGNLWLFGGEDTLNYSRNDMWEYNVSKGVWTWMSGSSNIDDMGIYGVIGQPSINNYPSARSTNLFWKDAAGNFWLAGGSQSTNDFMFQDIWKFNPQTLEWTWVKGSSGPDTTIIGANCTADTLNEDGPRYENRAVWKLSDDLIITYNGFNDWANEYAINDLWAYKVSSNQWLKINSWGVYGDYGVMGIAAASNYPASRIGAVGFNDNKNNLWMFSGNPLTQDGLLNDLWEYVPDTACINAAITGVQQLQQVESVLLYPNPCSVASVQLAVGNELIGSRLAVYDIQGQLVFTSAIRNPQSEIPVSGLAAGVYFVQVSSPNGGVVRKLVKM